MELSLKVKFSIYGYRELKWAACAGWGHSEKTDIWEELEVDLLQLCSSCKEPVEVIQTSNEDASGMPPCGATSGTSDWEEAPGADPERAYSIF